LLSGLIFSPFLLSSILGANLFEMQNMRRLFAALNLIQIALVLVIFTVAVISGEKLAEILFHKAVFYYPLLLGLISSLFLTFQNIILAGHQASESYNSYNLINILRPFFLISMLAVLYFLGLLNFFTVASSFLLSYILAVAGDLKVIVDSVSLKGMTFRMRQFAWFWRSLKYLIIFFFIRAMLDHIARFMVSRYFSVEDNANFGVAFQYYAMVDLLIYTVHVAFMNIFSKEEAEVSRTKYINWLKISGIVSLVGLCLLPYSQSFFTIINGEKYASVFPVFSIFMVGMVFYLCFSPAIYAIASRKMFKTLFFLSLIALIWQITVTSFAARYNSLNLMAFSCVGARGLIYISSFFLFLRKT
jgi:O-antigen/teichoic acid export membrane protein